MIIKLLIFFFFEVLYRQVSPCQIKNFEHIAKSVAQDFKLVNPSMPFWFLSLTLFSLITPFFFSHSLCNYRSS